MKMVAVRMGVLSGSGGVGLESGSRGIYKWKW